nr:hypothetical protein CFP56_37219 [Quercus suber]
MYPSFGKARSGRLLYCVIKSRHGWAATELETKSILADAWFGRNGYPTDFGVGDEFKTRSIDSITGIITCSHVPSDPSYMQEPHHGMHIVVDICCPVPTRVTGSTGRSISASTTDSPSASVPNNMAFPSTVCLNRMRAADEPHSAASRTRDMHDTTAPGVLLAELCWGLFGETETTDRSPIENIDKTHIRAWLWNGHGLAWLRGVELVRRCTSAAELFHGNVTVCDRPE